MALSERDRQFEADLERERRRTEQRALAVAAFVGVVGASSAVIYGPDAASGSVVEIGRVLVGLLGVVAAVTLRMQPGNGWLLAMAWALIQIPVYAWSPEGSPNLQMLSLPLTMTNSTRVNGVMTAYSSVGVNLAGIGFALLLRALKSTLVR